MKIWQNTVTLDKFAPQLTNIYDPSEAEVAVIGGTPIVLDELPKLRGLFKCGIGRDNVPEEECEKRGIAVCFPSEQTQRIIFEETANFTVYLIFRMLYADIGSLAKWEKRPRSFSGNQKVLLIGLGNIGNRVKDKLAPSVELLTYDVVSNRSEELPDLMNQADVVSLHIPLIESTRGFIDRKKLSWMKDDAALVNTARGPIVDEGALLDEIKSKRLRAAFDVFWQEPYEGSLKQFHPDRFLMSPHVASTCEDFLRGMAIDLEAFLHNLEQQI
jgi:phosphoglycerate dehydrogenase-like enzyme